MASLFFLSSGNKICIRKPEWCTAKLTDCISLRSAHWAQQHLKRCKSIKCALCLAEGTPPSDSKDFGSRLDVTSLNFLLGSLLASVIRLSLSFQPSQQRRNRLSNRAAPPAHFRQSWQLLNTARRATMSRQSFCDIYWTAYWWRGGGGGISQCPVCLDGRRVKYLFWSSSRQRDVRRWRHRPTRWRCPRCPTQLGQRQRTCRGIQENKGHHFDCCLRCANRFEWPLEKTHHPGQLKQRCQIVNVLKYLSFSVQFSSQKVAGLIFRGEDYD